LLCGVLLLGERVPPSRWLGFGIVWLALLLLTADSLRTAHRRRSRARSEAPALVA
jgi:chloramphenicol-sensitive protein RarD